MLKFHLFFSIGIAKKENSDPLIGFSRKDENSPHEWADGSTSTFTNWRPGEPNDDYECAYVSTAY